VTRSPGNGAVADAISLDQLAAEPALVATVPLDALADLYRRAAALEAIVRARLVTAVAARPTSSTDPSIPDRLLTIPQVAEILGVPKSYAYELARQRRLPALRFGKYVRVGPAALATWLTEHQGREGGDSGLNTVLSSSYGRRRGAAGARSARANPG
jgi:excisionase family DNA binding protein